MDFWPTVAGQFVVMMYLNKYPVLCHTDLVLTLKIILPRHVVTLLLCHQKIDMALGQKGHLMSNRHPLCCDINCYH